MASLDDKEIEIELAQPSASMEIMGPPGMEEMTSQLQNMFESVSNQRKSKRRMPVKGALKAAQEEEAARLVNEEEIRADAVQNVEQNGIVFIDEIDKITRRQNAGGGADVSREGVQRDLLPLIEGCTVSTKHGLIKTNHILFIASGAFHLSKPADLVPELQGRLPIRVELKALTVGDLERILTEPKAALITQYIALLGTEGLTVEFNKSSIKRLAEIAYSVNDRTENIGARRLHTIMERLLEVISFEASDRAGQKIKIDRKYVNEQLDKLVEDEDMRRWIL